ncbi:WW domain [Phytophthora cinnamomi]|uniref:WW domain n=1 Tax=Phytophthora cinnamomi TaxID=4785 RepID=UPI0035599A8A|nr:WW domain [Phytophthora cinnamomi]
MRTEVDASAARIKKKKRSSEHSKRHDRPAEDGGGEWKQFTSPDGHPYYYNAVTKESRWELPKEEEEPPPARSKHRRPKGSSKQVVLEQEAPLSEAADEPQPKKEKKKRPESRRSAAEEPVPVRKSKNAMFQKLQASLEGRLNPPVMGRPPPMLNIRREGEVEHAGGAAAQEEEQYEAETAGMSAAERLRFLRKKRQENMMAKRESITGDDFMAEVANNMKKKGATLKSKEKERDGGDKAMTWKEQEQAEEERKRQQMQAEMEAKEQEVARKEREEQAAREREQRREQERAEQIALEERREQERRQRQEEERIEKEEKKKKKEQKKQKNVVDLEERDSEHDTLAGSEQDPTAQDTRATTDNLSYDGAYQFSRTPYSNVKTDTTNETIMAVIDMQNMSSGANTSKRTTMLDPTDIAVTTVAINAAAILLGAQEAAVQQDAPPRTFRGGYNFIFYVVIEAMMLMCLIYDIVPPHCSERIPPSFAPICHGCNQLRSTWKQT